MLAAGLAPRPYTLHSFCKAATSLYLRRIKYVVISRPSRLPGWATRANCDGLLAITVLRTLEVGMEQRAPGNSPASGTQSSGTHHEGRGAWVLTAYGVSGLALFGILIYY